MYISAALLAIAFCIGLAACAPSPSNTSSDDPKSTVDNSVYASYTYTNHSQLIADTAYLEDELGYNPHGPRPAATSTFNPDAAGHFDDIDNCLLCHAAGTSGENVLWCTSCHIGMEMPEGWESSPTVTE
jgi:hypothetical protein